jgi:hypothetical protein
MAEFVVTAEAVDQTIESFTRLDKRGDKRAMNKLAQRLQREQPHLLQFAAQIRTATNDTVGEAAVFYATLVWAMFDRGRDATLARLTPINLTEAEKVITEDLATVEGLAEKPPYEQTAPVLATRQPHVFAKLRELLAEDVKENAMTAETCQAIVKPTQVVVEAFDAALSGRRPGEPQGTIVAAPKTGRNEPCPCGSGKKYKKCHGSSLTAA